MLRGTLFNSALRQTSAAACRQAQTRTASTPRLFSISRTMASQRVAVAAGLPKAGLSLGELAPYTQSDIYVRALRALGRDAALVAPGDAASVPELAKYDVQTAAEGPSDAAAENPFTGVQAAAGEGKYDGLAALQAARVGEVVDPSAVRFYFASKLGASTSDAELSIDDLVTRVNAELVNKIAATSSRVGQFVISKLDNQIGKLPFEPSAAQQGEAAASDASAKDIAAGEPLALAQHVVALTKKVQEAYLARDLATAASTVVRIADVGDELMKLRQPWNSIRKDKEEARAACTLLVNIYQALIVALYPIAPKFAQTASEIFAIKADVFDVSKVFTAQECSIGEQKTLLGRYDAKKVAAALDPSKAPAAAPAAGDKAAAKKEAAPEEPPAMIDIATFAKIDLRVATVLVCEPVKKSKKLLRFELDAGDEKPRQILSGIAAWVKPEEIVGKRVAIVANLAPVKMMGLESHGMILSACDDANNNVQPVLPSMEFVGGTQIR